MARAGGTVTDPQTLPAKVNTLDRYEILGELGRGAISIVYDARDLVTDDPVALKVIEPSLWAPPTAAAERSRFLTEAMPEWRLRHPNIVKVYDAGDSDGRLYIAMERLEGCTLRRMLEESPLPGVPRSLRMAAELASGLAYAHDRGVMHRYLKPSNIFVFDDDRAKITDFGMAPLRDALASTDHAECLSYMSPEEIRRDPRIDERRDIFSLGVVLYEMLTGERPFGGDSPDEIVQNVLEAQPLLPSQVNGDVPPMVDLLVWSMLAKRPFFRASSAEIVARRLRELLEEVYEELAVRGRDDLVVAAETTGERASGHRNIVLMPAHRGDDRAPSAEIFVHTLRDLGEEEVDRVLAAHARDEGVFAAAETTGERASDDRDIALTLDSRGDDRAPTVEISVHALREAGEKAVDRVLAAHARDEAASAAAETTGERASGDRDLTLTLDDQGAPSAEILVHPLRELREEEGDGVFAAHARGEGVSAATETTGERASGDRDIALTLDHQRDDRAPSPEIFVQPVREPRDEEVDGALTERTRDEGVSAATETAGEHASGDRDVTLTLDHQGGDRAPSAEIFVHPVREPREEKVDGTPTARARDEGVSPAEETTGEHAAGDRNMAPMPDHQGDDLAPRVEIFGYPLWGPREEERASGDAGLMPGHQGALHRAKLRLPTYALTVLILAAAGSVFLWQWRQSSDSSEAASATRSEKVATAITFEPAIPDPPRLSTSEPESKTAASEPEPTAAASAPQPTTAAPGPQPTTAAPEPQPTTAAVSEPQLQQATSELQPTTAPPESQPTKAASATKTALEPEPKKAASAPQPKERASKAPARKPARSAVASSTGPAREIEPPVVALAAEPAAAPLPPPVKTATVVFDVSPWGVIYVDGQRHGTTPPVNTVDLPPGRHRIEVRNPAQPPYINSTMLEPGEVRPIRHRFE